MRLTLGMLGFVLGLGLLVTLPASAADKASPETIAKLVEKLGSGEFAERQKATKELEALGEQALEALKKGVKSDDLEIRSRAEELLKKVESKALTRKILEPTKVRLSYKDKPLNEALEDLRQKTGLNITVQDPENKLAERKITLDTGETTLWEAVDLFVKKSGLAENLNVNGLVNPGGPQPIPIRPLPIKPIRLNIQPLPVPEQPVPQDKEAAPPGAIQVQKDNVAPAQPAPQPAQPAQPVQPGFVAKRPPVIVPGQQPNTLTLTDGKAKELPTFYAGSLRIRALPLDTPGIPKADGELIVPLQVTPEPKLQLQSVVNVRIEKVVDDQDQTLQQAMAQPGDNGLVEADQPAQAGFALGVAKMRLVARPFPGMPGVVAPVPVRLKKGEKATKMLKELSGVLSLQIRTPQEPLMTIEKLLDAAAKEAKGTDGGRLKLTNVTKGDKSFTLEVEFDPPQDVQGGPGLIGPIRIQPVPLPAPAPQQLQPQQLQQLNFQIQVQVQPAQPGQPVPAQPVPVGPVGRPIAASGINGLDVVDADGKSLPMQLTKSQAVAKGVGGVTWKYTLEIPVEKGQGEPAKLVYSGTRLVTLDVPFTLKDVPVQ